MSSRGLPGPIHVAVEDDRDKLKKANDRLTRENEDLKLENQKLKMQERRTLAAVANLKNWLAPLHGNLKALWGEFDSMDLPEAGGGGENITPGHIPSVSNSRFNAALLRLAEGEGKVLRLIMDVGPMSVTGISASLKMSTRTIYNITPRLAQMGLAKIIDGKLRLIDED